MPSLTTQIVRYLYTCEFEKKLSPDTLKAYRIDLMQFAAFVRDDAVDKDLLGRYAAYINQTFAPRSVKRKLASVRAFYGALEEQETIEESPFHRFHLRIAYPKQLPRTIPAGTVEALLRSAYGKYRHCGDRWALRDALVLELLFSTGVRVSELCGLTILTLRNIHLLKRPIVCCSIRKRGQRLTSLAPHYSSSLHQTSTLALREVSRSSVMAIRVESAG